jgi:hypothetical protein
MHLLNNPGVTALSRSRTVMMTMIYQAAVSLSFSPFFSLKPIIAISARVFFPARVPIFEFRAVTTKNVTQVTDCRMCTVWRLQSVLVISIYWY